MRKTWITCVPAAAALLGCMAGLPVAVGADGDKPAPPTRAEWAASQLNLKQIVLAIHSYSDAYQGAMPANVRSKDGKPLLSWRVTLLPFMNEDELYKQFKLDEPWDSANNKPLAAKMPKVFAPVRVKAKEGETFYQVFVGEKAPYNAKGDAPKMPATFADGTTNTGLVFEAGEPVIWTKPADLPFDEKKPLPKLGGLFDGQFNVGKADGSVIRVRKNFNDKEFRKLIMPSDGEVIDFSKLEVE